MKLRENCNFIFNSCALLSGDLDINIYLIIFKQPPGIKYIVSCMGITEDFCGLERFIGERKWIKSEELSLSAQAM